VPSGTEIAALEARRNEDQVLAEGALIGERRAAWARLAMIAMFGVISNLQGLTSLPRTVIGAVYTALAIGTLYTLYRIQPAIEKARVRPFFVASVDFAFVTTMGILDPVFNPGMATISMAIVLSFSVARSPLYHVVFSMVLAPICFLIVALSAGYHDTMALPFITGGLLVLGLMILVTNIAVRAMFSGLRKRDNLARFLPRQVADRVIASGSGALAPVQREVTVMFTDIRGFTGMSEGLEPKVLLAMLDDYFGRMSQVAQRSPRARAPAARVDRRSQRPV
jgi:adenylate cyclase